MTFQKVLLEQWQTLMGVDNIFSVEFQNLVTFWQQNTSVSLIWSILLTNVTSRSWSSELIATSDQSLFFIGQMQQANCDHIIVVIMCIHFSCHHLWNGWTAMLILSNRSTCISYSFMNFIFSKMMTISFSFRCGNITGVLPWRHDVNIRKSCLTFSAL